MKDFAGHIDSSVATYAELWKKLGHYICPVCMFVCECLSCKRQKQNQHNRNQKMLKSLDRNDKAETPGLPKSLVKLKNIPERIEKAKSFSHPEKYRKRELKALQKPEPATPTIVKI